MSPFSTLDSDLPESAETSPTGNQSVWAFQNCVLLLSETGVEGVVQAPQQGDTHGGILALKTE